MTNLKTQFPSVQEYIASFPKDTQKTLHELRSTILNTIPDSGERISYNMPTFTQKGVDVIYFAAWKSHISLYPFTDEMAKSFPETKDYNTSGKGTIQFPLDKPLPLELVRKITQHALTHIS